MTPATIQTHFEAKKEKMVIRWVDIEGTPIPSRGEITIDLTDLRELCKPVVDGGEGLTNRDFRIRILKSRDAITCDPIKCAFLATEWEPDV